MPGRRGQPALPAAPPGGLPPGDQRQAAELPGAAGANVHTDQVSAGQALHRRARRHDLHRGPTQRAQRKGQAQGQGQGRAGVGWGACLVGWLVGGSLAW